MGGLCHTLFFGIALLLRACWKYFWINKQTCPKTLQDMKNVGGKKGSGRKKQMCEKFRGA